MLPAQSFTPPGTTLTQPAEVRALPQEQAELQVPVHLTARVAYIASPGTVFVQDDSGGTFFRTRDPFGDLAIGDLVEVQGVTFPGLYLTGIDATSFKVLKHGDPPPATPANFEDLLSGRFHYQRVALQGVVRRLASPEENRSQLMLALGPQMLEIRIDATPPETGDWVDALVEVEGLAAGGINDRRQLVQPYLRVASWDHIRVVTPPVGTDQIPTVSATRLLRFSSDSTGRSHQHRVRVAGVVLASFPDGRLYLREPGDQNATALAARLTNPQPTLAVGQNVSVIGFPHMGGFSARLEDAVVTDTEEGEKPLAIPTTLGDLTAANLDADLIHLKATLIEYSRTEEGLEMRLKEGASTVAAVLPEPPDDLPAVGSLLALTGIYQVDASGESGFRARPTAARLLLRSAADMVVLHAPSWWSPRRLITLVGVLVGLVLTGLVWISLLHRQVAIQATALRSQIAKEAVLEERQRIAREFHDTLEQELAGLSIRLGALGSRSLDDKASSLLQTSLQLVARIQTEARNLVADLRSSVDASGDLRLALQDLVDRQAALSPAITVAIDSPLPSLPAHIVHHLRMIAQEAFTNILKHADARNITLSARTNDSAIQLQISDDGRGFTPAHPPVSAGHFGCIGIRERCRKMGATVDWKSTPGQGTSVTVNCPITSGSQ